MTLDVHRSKAILERHITELLLDSPPKEMPTGPPKAGRYLLNTDASIRKGEAAIGVVLSDPEDRVVVMLSESIGPATIPEAEYGALIKGLQIAHSLDIRKVRAYLDNQTVVDQINQHPKTKVKDETLRGLRAQVTALLEEFTDKRVYWVPRERNKLADALVGQALQAPKADRGP